MPILTFPKAKALSVINAHLATGSEILVVKDSGVYIMVGAEDSKDNVVEYATGYDPDKNESWYDKAYNAFGGDDFGVELTDEADPGMTDYLKYIVEKSDVWKTFRVHVNQRSLKVTVR